LLRPSQPERIDTLAAVEELRRVAFVDEHVSPKDGSVFVNVPLVAALFGRRKLSVSPERIQIDDNTKILQRFGAMQLSDLQHGIEPRIHRFFGSLSEDLAHKKVTLSKETPLIELVAGSFPPAWLMVADLWRESDDPSAPLQVKTALSRYLEMTTRGTKQKVAWDRLAAIYRNSGNWPEFVDTQIHIAELPGADLDGISAAVNTFNSVTRHLDSTARLNFAQRLAAVMEPKITEGDATDCSRLAWVLLYCDRAPEALKILDRGLRLEPTNEFCRSLKAKIWEKKLDAARIAGDQIGALDASVHLVEIPGAEFSDISETANTINKTGDIERDLRWTLSRRLMNVMEPKILNGDATDYSRLAWLMIHAGELERAHAIVERGLSLDANSEHCLRLKARLASHLHAY
jgi:tetratricopeptide (TPR) repeat protein